MIAVPTKQTDKKNLTIAEFLGVKLMEDKELIPKDIYPSAEKIPFLRFDKSFDWLMVAYCYLLSIGYSFQIVDGTCVVMEEDKQTPLVWNTCDTEDTDGVREILFNSIFETIEKYYTNEDSTELRQLNEWGLEEEDAE